MSEQQIIAQTDSPAANTSNATTAVPFIAIANRLLAKVAGWMVPIWILGVVLLSIRNIGGWILVRGMVRHTQPITDPALLEQLANLVRQMQIVRTVRLMQSTLAGVPMVIGWFRPSLLIPVSMFTELSPQQWDAILAHELAHIRRSDYLLNLLQIAAETLLFYHPAVWWLSREIRIQRENCCDDMATAVCGSNINYAEALLAAERHRRHAAAGRMAVAAIDDSPGSSTLTRVRRILGIEEPSTPRYRGIWLAMLPLAAVTAFIALSLMASPPNRSGADDSVQTISDQAEEPGEESVTSEDQQDEPAANAVPKGMIRIVDSQGKPIVGEEVRMEYRYAKDSGIEPAYEDGPIQQVVTTDAAGLASLPKDRLRNNYVELFIAIDGYVRHYPEKLNYSNPELPNQWSYGPIPIAINADGRVFPDTIELTRYTTITGTTIGPNGQPMGGIPLSLTTDVELEHESHYTANHLRTISADDGTFTLDNAPPGRLTLYYPWDGPTAGEVQQGRWSKWTKPGQQYPEPPYKGITWIKSFDAEEGETIDITVDISQATGILSGKVVDAEGNPLSGVTINAIHPRDDNNWYSVDDMTGSIKTDPLGRYYLMGLAPGKYAVRAEDRRRPMKSKAYPMAISELVEVMPDTLITVPSIQLDSINEKLEKLGFTPEKQHSLAFSIDDRNSLLDLDTGENYQDELSPSGLIMNTSPKYDIVSFWGESNSNARQAVGMICVECPGGADDYAKLSPDDVMQLLASGKPQASQRIVCTEEPKVFAFKTRQGSCGLMSLQVESTQQQRPTKMVAPMPPIQISWKLIHREGEQPPGTQASLATVPSTSPYSQPTYNPYQQPTQQSPVQTIAPAAINPQTLPSAVAGQPPLPASQPPASPKRNINNNNNNLVYQPANSQSESDTSSSKTAAEMVVEILKSFPLADSNSYPTGWEIIRKETQPSYHYNMIPNAGMPDKNNIECFRLTLRQSRKEYLYYPQQAAQPMMMQRETQVKDAQATADEVDFRYAYTHVQVIFVKDADMPEGVKPEDVSAKLKWDTLENEYHSERNYLGHAYGYHWYADATIVCQHDLLSRLGITGGIDPVDLLIRGLSIEDRVSYTRGSMNFLLVQHGDNAVQPLVDLIEKNAPSANMRNMTTLPVTVIVSAMNVLGQINTEKSAAALVKLYDESPEGEVVHYAAGNSISYYTKISNDDIKRICLDLLRQRKQVEYIAEKAVTFGWTEAIPMLKEIVEKPNDYWGYRAAFFRLRELEGKPVDDSLKKASEQLQQAAYANDTEAIDAASKILLDSEDKEAVAVYALLLTLFTTKGTNDGVIRVRDEGKRLLSEMPKKIAEPIVRALAVNLDENEYRRDEIRAVYEELFGPLPPIADEPSTWLGPQKNMDGWLGVPSTVSAPRVGLPGSPPPSTSGTIDPAKDEHLSHYTISLELIRGRNIKLPASKNPVTVFDGRNLSDVHSFVTHLDRLYLVGRFELKEETGWRYFMLDGRITSPDELKGDIIHFLPGKWQESIADPSCCLYLLPEELDLKEGPVEFEIIGQSFK